MRPLAVVVVDVDAEDAFEVAPIQDQQPVQALGAHGSDEALRDRVGERRQLRSISSLRSKLLGDASVPSVVGTEVRAGGGAAHLG